MFQASEGQFAAPVCRRSATTCHPSCCQRSFSRFSAPSRGHKNLQPSSLKLATKVANMNNSSCSRDRDSPALITREASLCALMSPLRQRRHCRVVQPALAATSKFNKRDHLRILSPKTPPATKCLERQNAVATNCRRSCAAQPQWRKQLWTCVARNARGDRIHAPAGRALPALAFAHGVLRLLRRSVAIRKTQKSCPFFEPFLSK
jgi:hypothetical protein